MFRFANPEYFHLLWLLLFLTLGVIYLERGKKQKLINALGERMFPFLTSSLSKSKRRWKRVLEVLMFLFAIIALARPQVSDGQEEIKSEGIELVIAFDVSQSMMAEDVRPSRLEFAKKEVSRLIQKMSGNKIGVVAFAGSAALVSPMTTDHSALQMFIDSLSPSTVGTQGTEFRRALVEAEQAFKRGGAESGDEDTAEEDAEEISAVTKAILLVSDGEDNEPGALDEAKKLAENGMHIFSLAFGTEKGAPIPVKDSSGAVRGYKKDANGKTILSATKGTVLKKLAELGKGSFHHVTFGGDVISRVVEDIGRLEKTRFEDQVIASYSEKFQIFLLIAFLFGLVEIILGERFRGQEIWRGRFEIPSR